MLCEKCGTREAVVRFMEMINGKSVEHNLCAQCVQEMGMEAMSMLMEQGLDTSNPIGKLVTDMMGAASAAMGVTPAAAGPSAPKVSDDMQAITCPKCGTSYKEFVEKSRFGCSSCYDVFGPLMNDTVKSVQSGDHHTGKHPAYGWAAPEDAEGLGQETKELTPKEQIRLLENQLADAVSAEDFENAAKFRGEIRRLKSMEDQA